MPAEPQDCICKWVNVLSVEIFNLYLLRQKSVQGDMLKLVLGDILSMWEHCEMSLLALYYISVHKEK